MSSRKLNGIKIEFTHHRYAGCLRVMIKKNHGVLSSGFSAIDKRFTDDMVKGFPVIHSDIVFEGPGYEAMFGWFQVISHDVGGGETDFSVDIAKQFQEFSNPFCYYGYKPEFYDAPSMNDPHIIRWNAYTFLCPLALSNTEEYRMIIPLAGFKWGYAMSRGRPSSIMNPVPASRDDWNLVRMKVYSQYPQWQFMDMPNMNL